MQWRVVEAFVGEYASGKSEVAINRALELKRLGDSVTLVDLDFVEPFYTLRPIKRNLEAMDLTVVGWGKEDSFGLGESGSYIQPAARWALKRPGHIIMDVGYGVHGASSLNLVEGALESEELVVLAVINIARPMTASVDDIVTFVAGLGRVDGLVNNSHLGGSTTTEIIVEGREVVGKAAKILGKPLVYTVALEELKPELETAGLRGQEVKFIHRYMPAAIW